MDISDRVKRIMAEQKAQGITISGLSEMSKIHRTTIYRIFNGSCTPDESTMKLLEAALCISDTPRVEPAMVDHMESEAIANIIAINEERITQMRCYYNRMIAEKDKWILRLFILCIALLAFICFLLLFDAANKEYGWLRAS